MMKALYILYVMFFYSSTLLSQPMLSIEKIVISNVNPNFNDEDYDSFESEGPFVLFKICIKNDSDTTITFKPNKSLIILSFQFEGVSYSDELFDLNFQEKSKVEIKPQGLQEIFVGTPIFLGTPILKDGKSDYSTELLKALPSVRIKYQEQEYFELNSEKLPKIIIK